MVVVAIVVQAVFAGLATYSYGVLITPIGAEFGAGRMEMMLGGTGAAFMTMLLSPAFGLMIDRRPTKWLMTAGSLSLAIALLLISRISSIWHFVPVFAICVAISTVCIGPMNANALVTRWFRQYRGRALSLAALGTSIGGFVFPMLLQVFIDSYGWRMACVLLAAISLLLTLPFILLMVHSNPEDVGLTPDGLPAADVGSDLGASAESLRPVTLWELSRDANFWQVAAPISAMNASYMSLLANLAPYAIGNGIAATQAALLISTIAVAGIAGKLGFSVFADRVNLKYALMTAMSMVALPLLLLAQTNTYPAMLLASVSIGLASGGLLPVWAAMLGRIYGPGNYGKVMGLMLPISLSTIMMAQPLTGYLFDRNGNYVLAFELLAGLLALGACVLAFLRAPR